MAVEQVPALVAKAARIARELREIRVTVEEMRTAYTNAYPEDGIGASEQGNQKMWDSALFAALDARRTELRQALVDLG